MQRTILVTGSTDGIGLEAARMLISMGHNVLLHGRNLAKLEKVERALSRLFWLKLRDSHLDLSTLREKTSPRKRHSGPDE